jgi:TM2 domain-containing membrane protein YozV
MLTKTGMSESSNGADDKTITALLAIFLGGFGVHRFYVGHMKLGVLYLCLIWTSIPAWAGVIEGILILVKDDDWYVENYKGPAPILD